MTEHKPVIMPFKGVWPKIGKDVFIAPTAAVIGDVHLGDRSNVWFATVLRGDDHYIRVGEDTNIQDGTIVHVTLELHPTVIGARVTIGHSATLHGCTIHDDAMIGMGATVLDGAVVESGAVVAAGAVVSPGKHVKSGELWAGVPARPVREVRDAERKFIAENAPHYHRKLALEYLKTET